MNTKFDELTKAMAQSVTRRAALKKFGVGLAGMALACFGVANKGLAGKVNTCTTNADCHRGEVCCNGLCEAGIPDWCDQTTNPCCCGWDSFKKGRGCGTFLPSCNVDYQYCIAYCGFVYCAGP
jgi:hypothetical protein